MATVMSRKGYGQVEPNHLSGIVTGQIYAQLPAATVTGSGQNVVKTPIAQLEQGQFAKYDYAKGVVDFDGEGEFMLVYNEEKLYDERKQSHKDFVYKVDDFTDSKMYPRLIKTNVGDIFTTNTFGANTSDTAETQGVAISEGNYLAPGTTGFLEVIKSDGTAVSSLSGVTGMAWKVVKIYTMPDGQQGVKIQRVQ